MSNTSEESYNSVDRAVERYLRHLKERTTPPSLDDLDESDRAEAEAIIRAIRACWGVGNIEVPPLEDDPIARELGLVPTSVRSVLLSGSAVKRARQRHGLDIKKLAAALQAQGYAVNAKWAFDLEQNAATAVDGRLAEALANVVAMPLPELVAADEASDQGVVSEFLNMRMPSELIAEWARKHGWDASQVRQLVATQLLAATWRRAERPGSDELMRMLIAYLESQER